MKPRHPLWVLLPVMIALAVGWAARGHPGTTTDWLLVEIPGCLSRIVYIDGSHISGLDTGASFDPADHYGLVACGREVARLEIAEDGQVGLHLPPVVVRQVLAAHGKEDEPRP